MPEKFAQQMDQISGSRPVYPMDDETFADVAAELPGFPDEVCNASRLQSALAHLSPQQLQVTTSG